MVRFWLALVLVLVVLAGGARAELQSLFPRNEEIPDTVTRAGLFAPTGNQGFFAPLPERAERVRVRPSPAGPELRRLIAFCRSSRAPKPDRQVIMRCNMVQVSGPPPCPHK
jgi:hypothetical protein